MTAPTPQAIASLFEEMEASPPEGPITASRGLLPGRKNIEISLELRFPERHRALTVRTPAVRETRELLVTAGVRCRSRSGVVEVVAEPTADSEIFCTLISDLVRFLETAQSPSAAVVRRIRTWQQMLAAGLKTGMSAEARLGLVGELLVLREIGLPVCGHVALEAWTGPMGTPYDFQLGAFALEVKCVSHRTPEKCRISNENQLDTTQLDSLTLVHQTVRTSNNEGFSLPEIIDAVRAEPSLAEHQVLLEERLLRAGWIEVHREQYDRERFSLATRRCYEVVSGFPRITPSDLPPGVCSVSYDLDLADCSPYLVGELHLRRALGAVSKGTPND
ncbi:PD-(D/E)XK motif protein [Longispora sp. K20-0274]|uniref:PD-(D/E)XK motif protein n=1 Tax=Longispora sp. K20-0274 TaxID=3088255 RepID=UPI00399AB4B7